jgi:hypothetical protein
MAVLALTVTPDRLLAQTADTETRTVARDLAVQGAEAYDGGDFATALDRFERAAALVTAPTITIMQARCLVALGRWVEALDRFHQVAAGQLASDAPEAFVRAQTEAQDEARTLEARMPRLELRLPDGTPPTEVSITLDDKPVPLVLLNVARLIDPGEHTIVTTVETTEPRTVTTSLSEGEQKVLTLELPIAAAAPVLASTPVAATATPNDAPPPTTRAHSTSWLTPVAFGVGGIGVIGAVISGLRAKSAQKELDAACDPGCPEELTDTLEDYELQRTLFYVSAGVGAVGLGAGAYLVLSEDEQGRGVRVGVTTKGVLASGRF